MKTNVDVAIIGAGPSGCLAAAKLKRAGIDCAIIESQEFPRFVIGESLLPKCNDLLQENALLTKAITDNFLVKTGAVFIKGDKSCTFDFSEKFTAGSDTAFQVQRSIFDHALSKEVEAMGVPIYFNHKVTQVELEEKNRSLTVEHNGESIQLKTKFILDGSGYGRVLPKLLNLEEQSSLLHRRVVFAHLGGELNPKCFEGGKISIVSHTRGAWVWCIPFLNKTVSVGIVAEPSFFREETDLLSFQKALEEDPNTKELLGDYSLETDLRCIEGYSVGIKQLYGEGYALLGNSTEFLDPIFSSGVTLALESASKACDTLIAQMKGEEFDWEDYSAYMTKGIEVFRTYIKAWYDGSLQDVFFAEQKSDEMKKQICSVLAGYVWDESNPFVKKHERALSSLARLCGQ